MKTSPYDFGIRDYSYRKPMCQEDMRSILDSIDKRYLYHYDAAIAALFNFSENFVLGQSIIGETLQLKSYLNYLFGVLFEFPQLAHYRPMLLFYIIEIDKCASICNQRVVLQNSKPSLIDSFLDGTGSEHEAHLQNQINSLYNDFLAFRGQLCDLFVDHSTFRNDEGINDFADELQAIVGLLGRCEMCHDECFNHGINNPLLSYISVVLLGYAFVCRPSFLHGVVQSKSFDVYVGFLKKNHFIESLEAFYGEWGPSLSSDFDPNNRYYFRGTHPSIRSYKYHYIANSNQSSDLVEQMEEKICYVCLDPDTDEFSIIGTDKEDFEPMAFLEEEIIMPVVCLGLDQSMIDILSSPEDHPDKQEIKSLIQDQNVRLTLTTKLDPESGFTVSIVDSGGHIADTFVFTPNELKQLQDSFH